MALLLAGLAWSAAFASAGGVHVSSLPADADVWIDGTYVGRSPLVVQGLEQGRHTLTVTKSGWTSQELPIEIPADSIAMTGVRLLPAGARNAKATGSFVIRKVPAGAQLSVDGRVLAPDTRSVVMDSGLHHLTISFAKGAAIVQSFMIYPETATALAMLDAAPASAQAAVIAQASDYLPAGSYNVSGGRFSIHYGPHEVAGAIGASALRYDGVSVSYDSAAAIIDGRLYLPLAFLEKLTGKSAKPR